MCRQIVSRKWFWYGCKHLQLRLRSRKRKKEKWKCPWYHLIFVSRHDPFKRMTNHWEGKRSACKVDYVWISWCHHTCLCTNTNTQIQKMQSYLPVYKCKYKYKNTKMPSYLPVYKYKYKNAKMPSYLPACHVQTCSILFSGSCWSMTGSVWATSLIQPETHFR